MNTNSIYRPAYDLDGVLAAAPPDSRVAWRHLSGSGRAERRQELLKHYRTAAPLMLIANGERFHVISARRDHQEIRRATEDWLRVNYGPAVEKLHLLNCSRTLENVIEFKSEVLIREAITDFYEDNPKVLRGVGKHCPELRLWLVDTSGIRRYEGGAPR